MQREEKNTKSSLYVNENDIGECWVDERTRYNFWFSVFRKSPSIKLISYLEIVAVKLGVLTTLLTSSVWSVFFIFFSINLRALIESHSIFFCSFVRSFLSNSMVWPGGTFIEIIFFMPQSNGFYFDFCLFELVLFNLFVLRQNYGKISTHFFSSPDQ